MPCAAAYILEDDTGVISATLVSIGTSLSGRELSSLDKSAVTSCTALFALVASPISSVLADHFGRKPVILLSDLLFVFGALVQAVSTSVSGMVLGRSIVGAAVGAASFVTPLYIAELAPPAYRGRLVTMNVLSITLGQVVAYIIGWIFAEHGDSSVGWRWMVGLGALPAILQCVLLFLMPETPRWLVKAGKSTDARQVIEKTLGPDLTSRRLVENVVKGIEMEIREEQGNATLANNGAKSGNAWLQRWNELMRVPKNRRALVIACLLQGLQQLCGFVSNSILQYYASLLIMIELLNVLFCHDFHDARVFDTNPNFSDRCCDQLCFYRSSIDLDRPHWSQAHLAILATIHGRWSSTSGLRLQFVQATFWRH